MQRAEQQPTGRGSLKEKEVSGDTRVSKHGNVPCGRSTRGSQSGPCSTQAYPWVWEDENLLEWNNQTTPFKG